MIRALNTKFKRRCRHVRTGRSIMLRALQHTAYRFCERSNLHGLKYTQCNRNTTKDRVKRGIWYVLCALGFLLAFYFIQLVVVKFTTTPTITTVETNNFPIWRIQFPAVGFCNVNKVYAPATRNIREKL